MLTVSGVVAVTVYFAMKKKQSSIIPQVQRTAITEQPLDRPQETEHPEEVHDSDLEKG